MPKGLRLSGRKLKLVANLAENPVTGGPIKKSMMARMGLDAIWRAHIEEDEAPALTFGLPTMQNREGGGADAR